MAEAPVVVVGAGMAGTAAAWAASREGKRVVLVYDRAGASELGSGALDLTPWDAPPTFATARRDRHAPDEPDLRSFIEALGIHRLGKQIIATSSGVVRPALGADHALLDLTPLAGRRIAVADLGRDDWDAALLARTLGASKWAERAKTTFVPVFVKALRAGHERRISPYDLAELHDDDHRRAALAEALKHASDNVDAWLVGPMLGLKLETITLLRRLVPLPLGETTSPMGGPAGARFEQARARVFENQRVEVRRGRLRTLAPRAGTWVLEVDAGALRPLALEARSVVLATGGVAAGGVILTVEPTRAERGFELPYQAPVVLGLDGEVQAGGGSLYGPSLETVGLGVLERIGILADTLGRPVLGRPVGSEHAEAGLFIAGDAVAGRPRTMLEAAVAGLAAGTVAARV
jgi:glycerol-3-phosphate dehydrogenase subunit B